ncbi:cytochrome P450 [Pontibacillus marinus]|uniref:Cytochrome P450 n=1 Tax=Pontibacillus marinus BH030004 = DSM 16465 TaxID=1385511 RepID=A0A0A5FWC1_9BACI|nr:cytochrome P450 [Pontibacillus marinus]KGX83328.1 hypothetical protein N783_04505 [Pontibacillus marinus BH030004 = DSM 16465]
MTRISKLPLPKSYGPLGNLPLLKKGKMVQSFMTLADEYGSIFQFRLPGRVSTIVSDPLLVKELSDESLFTKTIGPALKNVQAFTGDGLFTAESSDPNWYKAHHILRPCFSQKAMKTYHDKMVDITLQLLEKWGTLKSLNVSQDMTRLTLDTIGLCGFNYRFHSLKNDELHPFIASMIRGLEESMKQIQRSSIQRSLMVKTKRQFQKDIQTMFQLVDEVIALRRSSECEGEGDFLSHMLRGRDPNTGENLTDENIRYQIMTLLIAGHETTSGLLSFAIYFLMKNQEKLEKAYEEVDRVFIDDIPTYEQVKQLTYIRKVLQETLRLWPTAPAYAVKALEDTVIGEGIPIHKEQQVMILLPQLHRNKEVWGDDVEAFIPERFEAIKEIPRHAYKPFGNGRRACIGQYFAMHEAALVLGMILKNFELIDKDQYHLKIKEMLTLKPDQFVINVKHREKHLI